MARMRLAALRVDRHRGRRQRRMGAVHAALRGGLSAFLNCHGLSVLSSFLQQILQSGKWPATRPRRRRPTAALRRAAGRNDRAMPRAILLPPIRASYRSVIHQIDLARRVRGRLGFAAGKLNLAVAATEFEAFETSLTNQLRIACTATRHAGTPLHPTSQRRIALSPTRTHPPMTPAIEATR